MYKVQIVAEDILEVETTEHSFLETKKNYFYYNLKDKMHYSVGHKITDFDEMRRSRWYVPTSDESWEWLRKHYLPKLQGGLKK